MRLFSCITLLVVVGIGWSTEPVMALGQLRNMAPISGTHSSSANRIMSSAVGDVIAGHSPGTPLDLWHGFYAPFSTQVVGVDEPAIALVSFLGSVKPNPARSPAVITFGNAVHQALTLEIYDVAGRLVRTLHRRPTDAGIFQIPWDLRSNAGASVGTGIYFVRMSSPSFNQATRFAVIR